MQEPRPLSDVGASFKGALRVNRRRGAEPVMLSGVQRSRNISRERPACNYTPNLSNAHRAFSRGTPHRDANRASPTPVMACGGSSNPAANSSA